MSIRPKACLWSLALFMPMMACNCPTVWKLDLPSPDGAWLATAQTEQCGGFGSAYVGTFVTLRKLDGTVNKGKPFAILDYPGGGPIQKSYVLSDSNAGGGVNLRMKWLTAQHLEVDYSGTIEPNLQVVKFGGVDITLRQTSAEP